MIYHDNYLYQHSLLIMKHKNYVTKTQDDEKL